MVDSEEAYNPGPEFEEDVKDPVVEISLTKSQELWLIQWPVNQLQPTDIDGKEITLQLRNDGELGSFKSSSGKSYDLVSFAAQEPDANVFVASGSESKVVGKISRRVCFVHYPEPSDFEKPISRFNRSGGSGKSSMPRSSATPSMMGGSNPIYGTSRDTITSMHTTGENVESAKHSKKKRIRDSPSSSEQMLKSAGRSSESKPETHASQMSSELASSEKSHGSNSKKKKNRA